MRFLGYTKVSAWCSFSILFQYSVFTLPGAISCAQQLLQGKPTNRYIDYVIRRVRLLQGHGIDVLLVFDGSIHHSPRFCSISCPKFIPPYAVSKCKTDQQRRQIREQNRQRAEEYAALSYLLAQCDYIHVRRSS